MLSEQEIKEIEAHAREVPYRRGACIEALKVVQAHRGWVSDEHIKDIAALLDMSPDEVDNVATFYNLIFRKPVGRNVIFLCDSISCWMMGYEQIYAHLRQKLGIQFGETTPDGQFTLLPVVCLGTCDRAPAMIINEDLHRNVTPEKLDEILQHYS